MISYIMGNQSYGELKCCAEDWVHWKQAGSARHLL